MKKLLTLTFAVLFAITVYAEGERPKATNYKEVLQQIEYPQVSRDQGIEGKVVVVLNLDKFGNLEGYTFTTYPCESLKAAVEKVLPNLKFIPAKDESGVNVAGTYKLPVNFELTI